MGRLNVNPTRMELTKLKKRLVTATRGHKLLKDKQDELMRRFIDLVKYNNSLRSDVEENLESAFKEFLLASAALSPEFLEEAISYPKESISVNLDKKNIMSVNVPVMKFIRKLENDPSSIYPYGYATTSAELDESLTLLYSILPKLLELAEVEKACQLMADERLNVVCDPIKELNSEEFDIINDLKDTLYSGTGIGLAAPQIGILKRVILIDLGIGGEPIILINPEIVESSGSECDYEGCLSYVGFEGEVIRPSNVVVEGINEKGIKVIYNAKGLLARAFCHEIDHLDGILYMSKAESMYELEEEE